MRTERDVEAALHLPVLAMIPVITKNQVKKGVRPSIAASKPASRSPGLKLYQIQPIVFCKERESSSRITKH